MLCLFFFQAEDGIRDIGVTGVQTCALPIYRKVQERGLIRGRSISAILAAAAYSACREMGFPRTLKDITAISNIKRRYISKAYRLLIIELDLKIPLLDPIKCIIRIANNAKISEKTKRLAINVMHD